jgi:predicted DNA-binding transcriptional regulator YafY
MRRDFRSFRPDRIAAIEATGETFVETETRGLEAYLRSVGGSSDDVR